MAAIVHKRHVVLYAWIASALVLVLGISLYETSRILSFTYADQQQEQAKVASTTEARTVPILDQLLSTTTLTAQGSQVPFRYEIVTSTAAQERGLSGRAVIPSDYGLLFVFPKDDTYGFWMKDMEAPIDMLWLSDSGQVIYALANVATSTYPDVFYPPQPARYVLETRAGESAKRGWTQGAVVPLPLPYGR